MSTTGKKMSVRKQVIALVGASIGCIVTLCLAGHLTTLEVGVNGPIGERLSRGDALVAEVMPPPAYIVEAHLVDHQLVITEDRAGAEAMIERGTRLRREYEDRKAHWSRTLPPGHVRDVLLREAFVAADSYFAERESRLVPAARAGDREAALSVLEGLRESYDTHRRAVEQVVSAVREERRLEQEAAAAMTARNSLGIGVIGVMLSVVLAWLGQRTVARIADAIQRLRDSAESAATGNLNVEVAVEHDEDFGRLAEVQGRMLAFFRQRVGAIATSAKGLAVQAE
jgi:methyl-accepting chemotaxis protein